MGGAVEIAWDKRCRKRQSGSTQKISERLWWNIRNRNLRNYISSAPKEFIMQNIEVSDEAYHMFMRYCSVSGKNASSLIKSFIKNAEMDEEYAKSKPAISHKNLCKRYGLI